MELWHCMPWKDFMTSVSRLLTRSTLNALRIAGSTVLRDRLVEVKQENHQQHKARAQRVIQAENRGNNSRIQPVCPLDYVLLVCITATAVHVVGVIQNLLLTGEMIIGSINSRGRAGGIP